MLKKLVILMGTMALVACNSGTNSSTESSSSNSQPSSKVKSSHSSYPTLSYAKPEDAGFNSAKLQLIDDQINSDVSKGFPGAGIVIIKDGKIIKETVYGSKRKYDDNGNLMSQFDPMTQDTMFDIASNSKMYATNYAIMHLVSEGKIDLSQPLQTYLPNYTGCDSNGQCRNDRRVIDLLWHDAGYAADPLFFNPAAIGQDLYSQNKQLTENLIETTLPFERPLGGAPVYSDVDFMLLGMIVEHVTGQDLDSYVENTFYKPLGLNHTVYNPLHKGFNQSDCASTEVNGNTRGNSVSFPNIRTTPIQCQVHDEKAYYSMGGVSGHAGLFSTLSDMAVLTQIMLNNGGYAQHKFWSPEVEAQFTAANPNNSSYGLGWRRASEANGRALSWFSPYASNQAVGHTGWTGTVTVIDPKYNLAIVLLTNKKQSNYANGAFAGDSFATGSYTKIITLAYQAMDTTNNGN